MKEKIEIILSCLNVWNYIRKKVKFEKHNGARSVERLLFFNLIYLKESLILDNQLDLNMTIYKAEIAFSKEEINDEHFKNEKL